MILVSTILWYVAGGVLLLHSVICLLMPTRMSRRPGGFWSPPALARLPSGEPIPPDMRFFAKPSEGFGRILFAESSLRAGMKAPPVWRRLLSTLLAGLVGFGLGSLMVFWGGLGEGPWRWLWWLLPTTGFLVFGWYNAPMVRCVFVCERGFVRRYAYPPGDLVKKGISRDGLAFLMARSLRQEDDALGNRFYRWINEHGHVVHQIKILSFGSAEARAEVEEFVGAILQGWRYFCLIQAFDALRYWVEVGAKMGVDMDPPSRHENTTISLQPGEVHFAIEGEPYLLRLEPSGEVRFTTWPLSEHLRGLAVEAFRERGLHQKIGTSKTGHSI